MDRIVEALQQFHLPIYQDEVPEDQLNDLNFFYFKPARLERNGTAHFIQLIEVAYVSQYKEDLMEEEIIDALESKGLKFREADYDRIRMAKTGEFADIVVFTVARPLRRKRCM